MIFHKIHFISDTTAGMKNEKKCPTFSEELRGTAIPAYD